ncbi:hypothetical protein BDP27DRAFT_1373473 [Rhodocollybia butyracea]|uniref:Uncharacterized protein n=1 Tax=Rhodocollybia butyracea TaxID=206335 RepID=A0A9P5P347_9AGAR|nr:hypothetical protein BDP27DRAFT_1373473 [Rhodocollybia butyracea]
MVQRCDMKPNKANKDNICVKVMIYTKCPDWGLNPGPSGEIPRYSNQLNYLAMVNNYEVVSLKCQSQMFPLEHPCVSDYVIQQSAASWEESSKNLENHMMRVTGSEYHLYLFVMRDGMVLVIVNKFSHDEQVSDFPMVVRGAQNKDIVQGHLL